MTADEIEELADACIKSGDVHRASNERERLRSLAEESDFHRHAFSAWCCACWCVDALAGGAPDAVVHRYWDAMDEALDQMRAVENKT